MGIGSTANPSPATGRQSDRLRSGRRVGLQLRHPLERQPFRTAGHDLFHRLVPAPHAGEQQQFYLRRRFAHGEQHERRDGGLLYKGTGTTGIVTFKNLILNGGYVRHASGAGDLFQLAGKVTLGCDLDDRRLPGEYQGFREHRRQRFVDQDRRFTR